MYLPFIGIGVIVLIVGAVIVYYGIKMPEDKKVDMGFGTYYDGFGISARGALVVFVGIICITMGFLYQA